MVLCYDSPRKLMVPVFSCSPHHPALNMAALGPNFIVFVFYGFSALALNSSTFESRYRNLGQ